MEKTLIVKNLKSICDPVQVAPEAHPIRRLGTPEDIAQAALFLASTESSWISGVVLDIAGGPAA